MDAFLQRVWYERRSQWFSLLVLPLSWLFAVIAGLRRLAYRRGWSQSYRMTRPVIVVGNITVGGTGKTPLTIWLAEQLRSRGLRVGIVLRGYGGTSTQWPRDVAEHTAADEVGDEAVLLAQRTGAVVVAGPDRVADAERAIELGAQVVLCDDGLQHYRLARDLEIAVIDEQRGLGNGRLLPSGPLREPAKRLGSVDVKVLTRRARNNRPSTSFPNAVIATPVLGDAVSLGTGERRSLQTFVGTRVHAIAGIGNPRAFFDALSELGLTVDAHPLPDHARLTVADLAFPDGGPVLMTEKDAVKCRSGADAAGLANCWAVRLDVAMSEADAQAIHRLLDRVLATGGPLK
ncbi:tetraacyldisaccharide 4'-kinase [Steroidobacter sp. S1-65]|uniref:Tetraacyldisaccharide 4'-kinase n=1 Tax=Steroidobacter gossypii TaxID=2805490 RepID=A0ABS1WVZ1_9GAMM|nr:tetraacyldisaccharide 4'-kinase [Steroidobacter gossypii]MBM0105145.1 tetraacyldisaccharide 4'-kinase [Steroidobacter gossypii]